MGAKVEKDSCIILFFDVVQPNSAWIDLKNLNPILDSGSHLYKQLSCSSRLRGLQVKHYFQCSLNSTLLVTLLFSSGDSNSPPPAVMSSGRDCFFSPVCSETAVVLTLKAKCFIILISFEYFLFLYGSHPCRHAFRPPPASSVTWHHHHH